MKAGEYYKYNISDFIIQLLKYDGDDYWTVQGYDVDGPIKNLENGLGQMNLKKLTKETVTGDFIFNNYTKCKTLEIGEGLL